MAGDRRPPVDVKALGDRLVELRGDRSLKDVARSIWEKQVYDLTDSAINMLEHGKVPNPRIRTIDALATEYGVSVEYLVYGAKEKRRRAQAR